MRKFLALARQVFLHVQAPALILVGVTAVYWKLVLTNQYTFLENPDATQQVLPWLDVQVNAIRQFSWITWDPYECAGQSLIGQVQPGALSPFTFLLALFPLSQTGHIQVYWIHVWFALIHFVAGLFAYAFFRDLHCRRSAAVLGAIFYATGGYIGNTGWPQMLAAAIWAPLVFLFLLRTLRGIKPIRNAALTGVALGAAWLSGHHGPSICLTLAAFGTAGVYLILRPGFRVVTLCRLAVVISILTLVSAAQVLPAFEYGKQALRWTKDPHAWGDPIPVPEHEELGTKPGDLLHVLLPGGSGLYADPFVGVVALSLIVLAISCAFRRREVRLFSVLGVVALLYSMPKGDVFYGFFYTFVPVVEKAREPIMALSIVHLCAAVLTAFGAGVVLQGIDPVRSRSVTKLLLWFSVITLGLFYLDMYLKPTVTSYIVDGDQRVGVIALLGAVAAATYRASDLGYLKTRGAITILAALIVVEQGNEVTWPLTHKSDTPRAVFLKPLFETQDVADFLRKQPRPLRLEWNRKDLQIGFGDWNRLESFDAAVASVPASFFRLGPWTDRISQLYGVGYTISKAADRAGQQELFSDAAGYKVFRNPAAFPRAWTVHRLTHAPDEASAVRLVSEGSLDLRKTAVITGNHLPLAECSGSDEVRSVEEKASSSRIKVQMDCQGLLIVSDNWFPGWHATVDGKGAPVLLVDTAIRGIDVGPGAHEIAMTYRPASVYWGIFMLLVGLAVTSSLFLVIERDGSDVLAGHFRSDFPHNA